MQPLSQRPWKTDDPENLVPRKDSNVFDGVDRYSTASMQQKTRNQIVKVFRGISQILRIHPSLGRVRTRLAHAGASQKHYAGTNILAPVQVQSCKSKVIFAIFHCFCSQKLTLNQCRSGQNRSTPALLQATFEFSSLTFTSRQARLSSQARPGQSRPRRRPSQIQSKPKLTYSPKPNHTF